MENDEKSSNIIYMNKYDDEKFFKTDFKGQNINKNK